MAVQIRFLPRTSCFLPAGDVGGETKHKRRQSILIRCVRAKGH